jgi:FkbM family methyltransferase
MSRPFVAQVDLVEGQEPGAGLIKRIVQRVLNRLGYQIMRLPAPHSHERLIAALLPALRVNCVIDVGGHRGEFYRLLRRAGYQGRVVSFEPFGESFQHLRRITAGDPDWRGWDVALGREAGTLSLNVPDSTSFASFLRPNDYCEARFPEARWSGRAVPVGVKRLDSLYPEVVAGIERPRVFLKMDTQGWDSQVIDGAGAVLADVVALQSEISAIPIYDGMRTLMESVAHYESLGFELTNLFPVTFDAADVRVIEYDCVMCRRA